MYHVPFTLGMYVWWACMGNRLIFNPSLALGKAGPVRRLTTAVVQGPICFSGFSAALYSVCEAPTMASAVLNADHTCCAFQVNMHCNFSVGSLTGHSWVSIRANRLKAVSIFASTNGNISHKWIATLKLDTGPPLKLPLLRPLKASPSFSSLIEWRRCPNPGRVFCHFTDCLANSSQLYATPNPTPCAQPWHMTIWGIQLFSALATSMQNHLIWICEPLWCTAQQPSPYAVLKKCGQTWWPDG